jgi:hypothetical protein
MRIVACCLLAAGILFSARCLAQAKHEALTPAEIEELRSEADNPPLRVKLYMRFMDERTARVTQLATSQLVEHRGLKMHDALVQATAISDEIQDNLDEYAGYETNQRQPVPNLKKVLEEMQRSLATWQAAMAALKPNPDYDFVLENCTESLNGLKEQIPELLASQAKYFEEKKKRDKEKSKQAEQPYVLP